MIAKLFSTIQTRLIGVFLLNTLLTVAIVMAFNHWLRSQLLANADDALLVSATQIADRVDEFNRSNRQVFSVGSRLPAFLEFLQADEEQRQDTDFRNSTRQTLDSLEIEPWDEYYVLSQALLDRTGRNILDTATENIGADESQQPYFRDTLLGGAINISAIQYRPDRGGIYYYYALPLRETTAPNSVIGVLRIQVSIASVQNIVFGSVRRQDLEVAIFDPNYVRVVDTQHEDLLFRSIATYSPGEIAALKGQFALPPLPDAEVSVPVPDLVGILSETRSRRVVSGFTTPHADKEERIAVVELDTVPWHLVVSQPAQQYYQPIQRQTTGILVLSGLLLITSLVSSYFVSRRITQPIRTLTAVAKQIAEGGLHLKSPVTSSDEVGTLAKTFNQMTTELESARATLEDRVEKRTQELSEINDKLKHEMVERQRFEKQALEWALERERGRILTEFIQKASHEFRTPLSIINLNSYLVKQMLPVEKRRHVELIEEQGRYIEGLIYRMVFMSRLDSGLTTPLKFLPIDEFITTVYGSRADTVKEKGAVIHLDLQAGNAGIYADSELLFIALQNILDNALKYSIEPTEISIRTAVPGEMVSVTIEDNGTGIPEELQERVFERFFRVDEAHTTRGFGLGLPIAKRIVENMGGTIELHSVVGQGTTVTIHLSTKPPGKLESSDDA